MAAGPVTIRNVDFTPSVLMAWQCLKAPITTAETVLTAAQLTTNMREMTDDPDTIEVIPVEAFDAIQIMVLADGTANQSPVLQFYGWSEWGPGHHIGTVTTDLGTCTSAGTTGFHASTKTHKSIRDAFTATTTYEIADQYVITADYEAEFAYMEYDAAGTTQTYLNIITIHKALRTTGTYGNVDETIGYGGTIGTAPAEANFPQYLIVDFTRSQYKYFGMVPTDLDSATSVGGIFKPLRLKGGLTSPTGA